MASQLRRRRSRREEALVRQEARSRRSADEQLKLLDARPGESKKERKRLK